MRSSRRKIRKVNAKNHEILAQQSQVQSENYEVLAQILNVQIAGS